MFGRELKICFVTLFSFISCFSVSAQESSETNSGLLEQINETQSESIIGFSESEVSERLSYLTGCTPLNYNAVVRAYLQTYLYKKPEKTRDMLSKAGMYFHIFEAELKANGMPEDLKYLSVTESALNPLAVSRCGATGLWQFMPATGSEYGLEQNSAVDERSNPVEATRAALKYLKRLYGMYNDWALALAAYNSGPGNVNRAIKRGHSRNFWVIQKYLPQETRNYVPAFVSATYICNFYMMHNLMPDYPDLDMQVTSFTKVFEGVAFQEICDATGLDFNTVIALNPGYKKYYVPAQVQGRYIVLPLRVMDTFNQYMRSKGANAVANDFGNITFSNDSEDRYKAAHYSINQGDTAERLAASFGCYKSHLIAWNHLPYQYAQAGKSLIVWRPNRIKEFRRIQVAVPSQVTSFSAAAPQPKKVSPTSQLPKAEVKIEPKNIASGVAVGTSAILEEEKKYVWHIIKRNESLQEIAYQYLTNIAQIQKLNGNSSFEVGARIKVKIKA
jgi:membrane-bound lytic murein transglycosylase D